MDWVYDRYDDLMAWERNPWKSKKTVFGSHFLDLMESGKPRDRALAKELRRLGVRLHQQALERYPELALPDKIVPPERNGFLKWLELTERSPPRGMFSDLPEQLERHRTGGPWDSEAARSWLAKEKALLDEVRSIGLMPEHSISGIDIGRWRMMYARPVIRSAEALLWEARLAVEDGNLSGALESVRAARGLARQLETTSLIAATVQILAEMQVQGYTLSEILPAVPAEQFDPTAWEAAMDAQVSPPSAFGRLMTGEWNVASQVFVMPMLADTNDPKYPSDPEALVDHLANSQLAIIQEYDSDSPSDWATEAAPVVLNNSHLTRDSRELTESLFVESRAWSRGFLRAQHMNAMTQAAFAIMKGEPIPNDPIHGLPYQWDPATRLLSPPDSPLFTEMHVGPITVPEPQLSGLR
jgi:hypothetical protein